jgi:UDP-glucose 4-epimerase
LGVKAVNGPAGILVVGGAGYIGSHVAHDLCELGYRVVVFDDLSSGHRANVPQSAELIEGDLRAGRALPEALADGIDLVFHFAARKAAGESMDMPHEYARQNIAGTLRLLRCMNEAGVSRFVFSSSAAVYGAPEYLPVDEGHPCKPENYYGYTKLAVEENLSWFARLTPLRYASLRYFNATGYDLRGRVTVRETSVANLCPVLMEVASGARERLQVFGDDYDTPDGTCVRDYIHVNDLAAAHVEAMRRLVEAPRNLVLNLGAERGVSVLEMIRAAERVLGRPVPFEVVDRRPGDPATLIASSVLASRELGWRARYSDLETIFETMRPLYGL